MFVVVNLIVDLLYAVIDPRVRIPRRWRPHERCAEPASTRRDAGDCAVGAQPAAPCSTTASARCTPCATSASTCARPSGSASSASRARASRRSRCRSSGLIEPPGRVARRRDPPRRPRHLEAVRPPAAARSAGKEIALVLQDPMSALDPVKTIGAQVIEAIAAHNPDLRRAAARKRAAELLGEVDIPQAERRLDDYPHQYSGGMRQRVAIAIAIANNPSVLIADEPTTALDVTTQAQVLALLDRLVERAAARAVILITHNLGIVVGLLRLGRRDVRRALRRDLGRRPHLRQPDPPLQRGAAEVRAATPSGSPRARCRRSPASRRTSRSLPAGCSFAAALPGRARDRRAATQAPPPHEVGGPAGAGDGRVPLRRAARVARGAGVSGPSARRRARRARTAHAAARPRGRRPREDVRDRQRRSLRRKDPVHACSTTSRSTCAAARASASSASRAAASRRSRAACCGCSSRRAAACCSTASTSPRSAATSCARCAGACSSSSRTRSPRSTRA